MRMKVSQTVSAMMCQRFLSTKSFANILVVKCSSKFTDFIRNVKSKSSLRLPPRLQNASLTLTSDGLPTSAPCLPSNPLQVCIDLASLDAEEEHSSQHNGAGGSIIELTGSDSEEEHAPEQESTLQRTMI
jgi:hypothetical protein